MNTDFHNSFTVSQYIRVLKTTPLSSYNFYSTLSVAAEQSGSEPHRLRGVADPTTACAEAPQDHGRGRAAPGCRGGMGPSGPGSD